MSFINIEIKARTTRHHQIRQFLLEQGAEFRGTDHQSDTYFQVANGRLKLREGKIENNLIFYERSETGGLKQSNVELYKSGDGPQLRNILSKALGVKTIVKKEREIYFIGNVKFHLDRLEGYGSFVEIEACNLDTAFTANDLSEQCAYYMKAFGVKDEDLFNGSYSDMIS
jgi:adenylate cyclase, class 2